MSLFTTVWNLLKKNPATDGNDIFNIQTMLNDNWDKLDAALGMKAVNADVRVATVGNIGLSGLQTIDGVTLTAGDRVLVKDQATGIDNGIYVAAADAWSRAPDADISDKLAAGLFVHVKEGSSNAGTGWMLATAGTVTLGSTVLAFVQKTGAGAATDAVIGTRTIDDSIAASSGADTPAKLWSKLGYMIRAITGKSNWYTAPVMSIEALNTNKLNASAYTPADVLSKLLTVDGSGSRLDADLLDGMDSTRFIFGDNQRGVRPWITGIDSIDKAGFFYVNTDRTNTPTVEDTFVLQLMDGNADNSNTAVQLAIPYGSSRMFFRIRSGTWASWRELWHSTNNSAGFAAIGYQKLASGLIIQWGRVTVLANSVKTDITFPIAFPAACINGQVTIDSSSPVRVSVLAGDTTGMSVYQDLGADRIGWWMAIGY